MRDLKRLKRVLEGVTLPPPRGVRFRADVDRRRRRGMGGGRRRAAAALSARRRLRRLLAENPSPADRRLRAARLSRVRARLPAGAGASFSRGGRRCCRRLARFLGERRRPAVVAGDSAGGTLALALLLIVKREARRPAAAALFSPATDMTGASEVLAHQPPSRRNVHRRAAQSRRLLSQRRRSRAIPAPRRCSASSTGLPPMLFHVGESELLRDDSVRFADAAHAAGVAGGDQGLGRRAACLAVHAWLRA